MQNTLVSARHLMQRDLMNSCASAPNGAAAGCIPKWSHHGKNSLGQHHGGFSLISGLDTVDVLVPGGGHDPDFDADDPAGAKPSAFVTFNRTCKPLLPSGGP